MSDFRDMARDPKHRRRFEKLLLLAVQRGDADLVAERLSWGIDPNCTFAKGRTPLNLAVSRDGAAWEAALTLETEPGEYSYPAIIQTNDGLVHITYTWKRQRVRSRHSLGASTNGFPIQPTM